MTQVRVIVHDPVEGHREISEQQQALVSEHVHASYVLGTTRRSECIVRDVGADVPERKASVLYLDGSREAGELGHCLSFP